MNAIAQFAFFAISERPFAGGGRFLVVLLSALLGAWMWLRYLQRRSASRSQAWQDLAAELDFSYKPSRDSALRRRSEEIEGVVDGIVVRLTRYFLAPGLDSAIYTRWSAALEGRPDFVLYVHVRHGLSRIAAMLGFDEISVGDEEFDRRWSTKSDEPARVSQLLTAEVRSSIQELRSGCVVINDTGVHVVWSGSMVAVQELQRGLEVLRQLLRKLRPPAEAKESKPPAEAPGPVETPGESSGTDRPIQP